MEIKTSVQIYGNPDSYVDLGESKNARYLCRFMEIKTFVQIYGNPDSCADL